MATTLFYPYTTLNQVRKETKNREAALADWFNECINNASRVVEEYCKRDFRDHVGTEESPLNVRTYWVIGSEITVPYPIRELSSILINDEPLDPKEWAWENASDIGKGQGVIYRKGGKAWSSKGEKDGLLGTSVTRVGGGNAASRLFGDRRQGPVDSSFDPTMTTIGLVGEFGYTWPNQDEVANNIPMRILRATTLIAAAFSGENRKEVIGLDGDKEGFNEFRIPSEAQKLMKPYKRLIL